MYAVMWSEHCSYKSSRAHLGRFPTEAPWVLVGPGEGAGVIDIGDGLADRDPHREPQPPLRGRAVPGRGDRCRRHHPRRLLDGRASDRADGSAAVRHPRRRAHALPVRGRRVGDQWLRQRGRRADRRRRGRVRRHLPRQPARQRAVSRHPADRTARARRAPKAPTTSRCCSVRRPAATASAARACSRRPGSRRGARRSGPSVQVGDPFEEKRLIEACLELLDRKLAIGVQDLGAAGLSCAASETAAKGGVGMDVDVARVAEARAGHERGRGADVREPGAHARDRRAGAPRRGAGARAAVGGARDRDRARHRHRPLPRVRRLVRRDRRAGREPGSRPSATTRPPVSSDREPLADVPVGSLGDGPSYRRPIARPAAQDELQADDPRPKLRAKFGPGADLGPELLALLATPTIADKTWVSRQYDHQLFLNTVAGPGADAAVLRVKGTRESARARDRRQGAVLPARPAHRRPPRRARSRAQRRDRRAPDRWRS